MVVTSNIQTQLDAKLPLSGGTMSGIIAGFQSTGIDDNASSTAVTIDSSGNVGIGTSSPSYLTHLYSTSAEPKLVIEDASSGAGRGGVVTGTWGGNGIKLDSLGAAGWVYVGGGNTSYIPFTIGTEKARFHNNGNFGLGTTSPDFLLDVAGRIGILEGTNGIAFHDGAGSVSAGVRADSGDNLVFATGSSDTERMRITSGGNVGIGETPGGAYKLQANGNIGGPNAAFAIYPSPGVSAKRTFSGSNNANATLHIDHEGGYNRFGCDNTSQHFAFTAGGSTSGDINVVFKGDGNVGIGTTNPSHKLHVVGDINYTGTLYNNGVASGGSPTQVLIKNSSGTTIKVRVGLNSGGATTNIKNSAGTTLITSVGPFISGDATF